MLRRINKQAEDADNRKKHETLASIIDEETKKAGLKRFERASSDFVLYKGAFNGRLGCFLGKKVMRMYSLYYTFEIDVKDNSYLDFAEKIGKRLEIEYGKMIEISYRRKSCCIGSQFNKV